MQKIWDVILSIYANGKSINILNLITELDKRFKGLTNSNELNRAKILWKMSGNVEDVINKIKENYAINKFRSELRKLDFSLDKNGIASAIEGHKENLLRLEQLYEEKSNTVSNLVSDIATDMKKGNHVIEFGISYMDDFAGGLTRGEISAIGGRPGDGKTTFGLFLARQLVLQGFKVLFINRELKNEAALQKLMIMESDTLTIDSFRKKELDKETMDEIDRVSEIIKEKYSNLIFVDNISTLAESVTEIRKIKPDIFFDDYIQMIRTEYSMQKEKRFIIEDIMFAYKWLAKELNITGFVLSQLNREIEKRIDKTPVMSDLAEGASIEHFSENVLFIRKNRDNERVSNLVVAKSRWGRTGIYEIGSRLDKCKYYETIGEASV